MNTPPAPSMIQYPSPDGVAASGAVDVAADVAAFHPSELGLAVPEA